MKRYLGITCTIALCLSLLVALSACVTSTETTDPRVTYRGKILTIALDVSGSAGYSWTINREGSALTELDDKYVSNSPGMNVEGDSGVHTYRFEGITGGETTLDFTYSLFWEPYDYEEKLHIEVKTADDGTIEEVEVSSKQKE